MTPFEFPQANRFYGSPPDLDEQQVRTIKAYAGVVEGGSLDGVPVVITAWNPSPDEIEKLLAGEPIYLSFLGGLPPHMVTMEFETARHPA